MIEAMNTDNEKELITKLQAATTRREAFEEVVRLFGEPLYWQIRRMVLDHDDANDLLQNTFIKAWTNLDQFRGEARLTTWLYRIALNECLNFLNRQKAQNQISISNEEDAIVNQLESDPFFDGDETQQLFQEAIHTLPEKQRMVFQMKYFEEMKYEDISDIMGTTIGSLKASYHHAVKKIEDFFNRRD